MDDVLESPLDVAGELRWFAGYGPAPVVGPCPHVGCGYLIRTIVAWGPSPDRNTLVACAPHTPVPGWCTGRCRAWLDQTGNRVTDYCMVDLDHELSVTATKKG